jgi:hypothetical protein
MPSIGAVSCFRVIGTLPVPKTRLALWTVPGIDGYGAQDLGLQDQAFEVVAVDYDTNANVQAWAAAIDGLQGQIVAVTDDHGVTTSNCLIVEVAQARVEAAISAVGDQRGEVAVRGVVLPS